MLSWLPHDSGLSGVWCPGPVLALDEVQRNMTYRLYSTLVAASHIWHTEDTLVGQRCAHFERPVVEVRRNHSP